MYFLAIKFLMQKNKSGVQQSRLFGTWGFTYSIGSGLFTVHKLYRILKIIKHNAKTHLVFYKNVASDACTKSIGLITKRIHVSGISVASVSVTRE